MRDWVKRALTRKLTKRGKSREQVIVVEPNERLVLLVKFAIGMTACLTVLEVANLAVLGKWSSEIFAAITGLIGTVTGVLIGHQAS
jgi:hypothetical protein